MAEGIRDNLYEHRKELDVLRKEIDALHSAELTARFNKLEKDMGKFQKCLPVMNSFLRQFGTYSYLDSKVKSICIITKVFPGAKTVDAVVFDSGGSGGTYDIANKHLGDGPDEVQPLLDFDDEEEDGGVDTAAQEAAAVLAA